MAIFCNRELMDGMRDIEFPKSKSEIITHLNKSTNISEASKIALNKLEDRQYQGKDEICENIKIVCDLEIKDALSEMEYPASKNDIMDYVRFRNDSEFVIKSLEELPDDYTFNDLSDICKEI